MSALSGSSLVITGVGMVTAVGHDALVTTTSIGADIAGLQEIPQPTRHGKQLVGAPIVACGDRFVREARLWELAALAAKEALEHSEAQGAPLDRARCGVMWVLASDTRAGYSARSSHRLRPAFLRHCNLTAGDRHWIDIPMGHAGALVALEQASAFIRREELHACLIGGVDSLIQLRVLRWLEAEDRLKHASYTDGLIPGEASAFFLVEPEPEAHRRAARPLARVKGVGVSHESATIVSNEPCRAVGLTTALRNALEAADRDATDIDVVYCDLNGESYRAREWGMASTRIGVSSPVALMHPADCIGDVGAAAGALLLGLAAMSAEDQESKSSSVIVFAGSESGERAATVLEISSALSGFDRARASSEKRQRARRGKPLPDLLNEHAEEVAFLWSRRQRAVRSPDHFMGHIRDLDRRIHANIQGLLVVGEAGLPILRDLLVERDRYRAFAAGYSLLRTSSARAGAWVISALEEANEERFEGLREALCHGPINSLVAKLHDCWRVGSDQTALAAAEALAFHGALLQDSDRMMCSLGNPSAALRKTVWRLVALLETTDAPFEMGWRDIDSGVRREALMAAAWRRRPGLLEYCRRLARIPVPENAEAIELVALLGGTEDLGVMLEAARSGTLGPFGYRLLGTFGHPGAIELLLEAIGEGDARIAAAASEAFIKITGMDVSSQSRTEFQSDDEESHIEFDRHFVEEAVLLDVSAATAWWRGARDRLSVGTRWCRGVRLDGKTSCDLVNQLDMESRGEELLRDAWLGAWPASPLDLECLPYGYGAGRTRSLHRLPSMSSG
jgi:3-oxoacyl-[acyl-carrier-protein] synthase-1